MKTNRGVVNGTIIELSKKLLGYEITRTELRLMPYIQFTMMNAQKLEPNRINGEERDVLNKWKKKGWVNGGASGMSITKEFWDAINSILWLAYVKDSE